MSAHSQDKKAVAQAIIRSRLETVAGQKPEVKRTCEGGCGVIGIIGSERLAGRSIIRSCEQMQNRGNGKGGGVAAAGLFPKKYKNHYAVHVAYLDEKVRSDVESNFLDKYLDIEKSEKQKNIGDHESVGLEIRPPTVHRYFSRVKKPVLARFMESTGIDDERAAEDEFIFRNSHRLNQCHYVDPGQPEAFVLSHAKDLMILKAVGFAEQVARFYRLEETKANVWIGHQRYPTRGRVWHPGGAHPFAGLNEALVHNGDFANYYAVSEYLRQRGLVPQFVTDTEVSVLLFDLYSRVFDYKLEYVIEALAPTPQGDFERLSKRRQRIYRAIQTAHLHGSPDGPWFFIVARNHPITGQPQLIGITDVSMLRPQVFSLQVGEKSYGAIGSEKQAIDAFFQDLSKEDPSVCPVADLYWNARGGSCTDGGAFVYTLEDGENGPQLDVRDKFGTPITVTDGLQTRKELRQIKRKFEVGPRRMKNIDEADDGKGVWIDETPPEIKTHRTDEEEGEALREARATWGKLAGRPLRIELARRFRSLIEYGNFEGLALRVVQAITQTGKLEQGWREVLLCLTYLRDRRWDSGQTRRAVAVAELERNINRVLDGIGGPNEPEHRGSLRLDMKTAWAGRMPSPQGEKSVLVIDAEGFLPEGDQAVCRVLVEAHRRGWKKFIVYRCHGDRFLGCGLGSDTAGVSIDVYGSSGDYLGSGMDGASIYVHGDAQDQVGQILKSGKIVIYGNVGQTFLYGAKGGQAYVMGSAAGRPLINAVGGIRAIINGTCLDYCAESFMAGKKTDGGFVIINGLGFDAQGEVIGLELKYPGNNLFSLASGGACYLNDPYSTVSSSQLNGATFAPFKQDDWNIVLEYLKKNETYFGISIRHDLLMVDGVQYWPKEVFRKVVASEATKKLDYSSIPG